jgi:hypothetical protein
VSPTAETAFIESLAGQDKSAIESAIKRVKLGTLRDKSDDDIDADNRADRLIGSAAPLGTLARDGVPPVEFLPGPLAQGMVYGVGSTGLDGHPGTAKTTIAQRLAIDYMREGGDVVYLDWEAGDAEAVERLVALGAPADLLDARMHYFPWPALSFDAWDELEELWDAWPGALGLWDSVSKALGVLGLKENESDDVTRFTAKVSELGKRRGVANLLIDHVTKAEDGKGVYSGRGSGAKLANLEGLWYFEKVREFSESEVGEIHLHRKRQRRGRLRPVIRLEVGDGQGGLPVRELDRDAATTAAGRIKRDVLALLAGQPGERHTKTDVRAHVTGENTAIDGALATLAADHEEPVHVARDTGGRATERYWYEPGRESGAMEI